MGVGWGREGHGVQTLQVPGAPPLAQGKVRPDQAPPEPQEGWESPLTHPQHQPHRPLHLGPERDVQGGAEGGRVPRASPAQLLSELEAGGR